MKIWILLFLPITVFAASIDDNDIITNNGNAYIVSTVVNAGVGFRSIAQLWNPIESGKSIYLDKITATHGYCSALSGMDMRANNVPLGTAYRNGTNKNLSISSQSIAQLRVAHVVEPVPDFPIYEFFPGNCWTTNTIELIPPVLIPQGRGAYMANGNNNANMPITFEYREY